MSRRTHLSVRAKQHSCPLYKNAKSLDMPIRADNEDGSQHKLKYSTLGFLASLLDVGFGQKSFDNADWSS